MESSSNKEFKKLTFHESTETAKKIFHEKTTSLTLTPEKRSESEEDQLNQVASPILESTFYNNNKEHKQFSASTPANVCLSAESPEHKSDSVIDILDRLCSPILGKISSGNDFGRSKHNCPPVYFGCPTNTTEGNSNLQKRGKRLFYDTGESKSDNHQLVKKVKYKGDNNDMEGFNIEDVSCNNNDLFKHHDVSENTLQVICDITENILEHNSSNHSEHKKSVRKIPSSVHSKNNFKLRGVNQSNQDSPMFEKLMPDSKLQIYTNVNENTLIYSATNFKNDEKKKISMNDLFLGVQILEEGNKLQKPNVTKRNQHTKTKYNVVEESSSNNVHLIKPKNEYKQDKNEIKEESLSFERNNSLTSYGISDTQFCEAVEAAEMATDLDLTLNKFSLENSDPDHKTFKASKETFDQNIQTTSTVLDIPTNQDFKSSVSLESLACNESYTTLNSEYLILKHNDKEINKGDCIKLCKSRSNEEKVLFTVEENPQHTTLRLQASRDTVTFLQRPLQNSLNISEDTPKLHKDVRGYQVQSRNTVSNDRESAKQTEFLGAIEGDNIVSAQISMDGEKSQQYFSAVHPKEKTKRIKDLKSETCLTQNNVINKVNVFERLDIQQMLLEDSNCISNIENIDLYQSNDKKRHKLKQVQRKETATFQDMNKAKPQIKSFQPVSGQSVQISEESLKRAKNLLDDEQETTTEMKGFQTASGKRVQISEDSLNKARKLLEDEPETTTKIKGFQNASGKRVQISDESLKKARKLLEVEPETITGINGFQTASGKRVQISEESLNKARKLLEDEPETTTKIKGFQTASGKRVQISDESLKKARKLLEVEPETITGINGFQTASGKRVQISEDSLNKARKLLDDEPETTTKIKGFQTASGKRVQISDESLKKTRKLLEVEPETITEINGFQTASGKRVQISEDSLSKARKLLEDEPETTTKIKCFQTASGKRVQISDESLKKARKLLEVEPETITGINGFQTASGKRVQISEDSLNKARKLLDDEPETTTKIKCFQTASGKRVQISDKSLKKERKLLEVEPETITGINGFQTASGKSVQISEDSLNKARKLIENDPETTTGIKGFQTASGKRVQISEDSLNKARKLLEDEPETTNKIKGFQTASGKRVQISEDSLNKARKLLEDEPETTTKIKGFQTASGKRVQISNESLKKARKLLEVEPETITGINGFQTASGKRIQIFLDSLNKARKLLEDEPETTTKIKGFQTASGKRVQISDESLKKARKLLEVEPETITGINGFQTASGKRVQISDESLKKARKLLEVEPETITGINGFQTASGKSVQISEDSSNKARKLFENDPETTTGIKGFQTASGKSVQISMDSLSKARKLIENDHETTYRVKGFQTASSKRVQISDESLNEARKILEVGPETTNRIKGFQNASGKSVQISEDCLNKSRKWFDTDSETKTGMKGFQTASGKSVQIREDSLNKARNLLEDEPKSTTKIKGFQTASGKRVQISEDSLYKARNLFENDPETTVGIKCFQTASGKSVQISDDSLNKARKLLEDKTETTTGIKGFQSSSGIRVQTSDESLNKTRKILQVEPETITRIEGFQTASGKSVQISEDSLNKARKLFENDPETTAGIKGFQTTSGKRVQISDESLNKARKLLEVEPETKTLIKGFQTASGKTVEISKDSLNKARKLFEVDHETKTLIKGFQTASGKTVKISEDSLNKARKILEVEPETIIEIEGFQTASSESFQIPVDSLGKERKPLENYPETTAGIKGFQTACGKSVQISKHSLYKARKLLEDETETTTVIKGFQTASGKRVQISEDSFNNARKLFEVEPETKTLIKGFQTASGKTVEISEDSLNKARKILEVEPETIIEIEGFQTASSESFQIPVDSLGKERKPLENYPETTAGIKGFQTACGKSVQISKHSLYKARKLLEDETETTTVIKGFQTASGKRVQISEDSFNNARKLFEVEPETKTLIKGFQTASGKTVEISEDSLNKARKILEVEPETITGIEGFQTASGESVQIPVDSLSKERKPLENYPETTAGIKGFHTASGKSVQISKDSLNKAKKLFEDEPETTNKIKGVIAASNKSDEVFEDSSTSFKDFSDQSYNFNSEIINKRTICDVSLSIKSNNLNKTDSKPNHIDDVVVPNNDGVTSPVLDRVKRQRTYLNVLDKTEQHAINEDKYSLSTPDKTPNFKTPKIQRKLIFSPFSGSGQNANTSDISDGRITNSSAIWSTVISEDDLSLLNQSVTNLRSDVSMKRKLHDDNKKVHQFFEESCLLTPEVAQEVSDSMAALMADEASTSPFCKSLLLKPILTSPSLMFDRAIKLPSIHSDDKETILMDKPLSPVLDAYSQFKPKKFLKKRTLDFSMLENERYQQESTLTPKAGSFKPPYATSTPIETATIKKTKRKCQGAQFLTPDVKRVKHDPEPVTSYEANEDKVIQARRVAAERQEQVVKDRMSSDSVIKPCKGSYLLRTQTESRRALKDLSGSKPPITYRSEQLLKLGIPQSVIEMVASNAEEFRFNATDYYSEETVKCNVEGLPVGDGALLILDAAGEAGVSELTRSFLSSPAVSPRLLPHGWVLNCLRWILLKLAATQRLFPHLRLLTPNNVMLQLKYRYDREIDRCQRPALRKVLEKDESPAKAMILFVAHIHSVETGERKTLELELSDGWYSVRTCIDHEMEVLVRRGVVGTGTKLLTQGAELLNCSEGCHPLEASAEVKLKICSNSTRRARWFARLGFCHESLPPLRLRGVLGRGGAIQALNATVLRSYPLLYREKSADGMTVVRGEKAEESAAEMYQQRRQQCAETILTRLQAELSSDPEELLEKDSSTALEQIEEKTIKMQQLIQEKLLKELDEKVPPRVVARMLKVRLADSDSCDDRSALLTLWNPPDQVLSFFSEGTTLLFHNLTATGYSRYGEVQLSAGRQTRFSPQPLSERSACSTRVTTSLVSLRPNFKASFSEIDVVGLVLPLEFDNPNIVYIADDNYNFLCISFWIALKSTGYLSVLCPGRVVAVSNLRWHAHLVSWNLPSAFATEVTVVSQHPRQLHLRPVLSDLALRLDTIDLAGYMEECVKRIKSLIVHRESAGMTPKERSTPVHPANNQQDVETPTGRRIARLEKYGDPPPLSPLVLSTPARLKRGFRHPVKKSSSNTSDDR